VGLIRRTSKEVSCSVRGDRKPTLEGRSDGDRSFAALLLLACGAKKVSKPRPLVSCQPLAVHQLKHGAGFVGASLALFRIMGATAEESNAWHFAILMVCFAMKTTPKIDTG